MSASVPIGLAIAMLGFAAYMWYLARRSAAGAMGSNGPGIRIAETKRCEHTWAAAQQVAAPIYQRIAGALAMVAALTLVLAPVNATAAFFGAVVAGLAIEIFFLGAASVRARKAAAAVDCEHSRAAKAQGTKAKRGRAGEQKPTSNFSPAHRRTKKRR